MARSVTRLSARFVQTCTTPGRHADGDGLYLSIDPDGKRRRWIFLFSLAGRRREMGIGSADAVSLAEARRAADTARALVRQGQDPIEAKRAIERDNATPTFGVMADRHIAAMEKGWRNPKHRAQWHMTLSRVRDENGKLTGQGYCISLRDKRVDEITTDDITKVLAPIWGKKPETARRIRGRIEAVLDAAKAAGFRSGENPAAWRGHLALLLPKTKKLSRGHHAAMPFDDVPALMGRLRVAEGVGALALEFVILSAARSGEARGARWNEINKSERLWIVPAERMKGGREHRVPLTDAALDVLRRASPFRRVSDGDDALIFPGRKHGAALSDMSLSAVLRRLDLECTVHGFRSSFRDWAGDCTNFPREVAEAALAHAVGDKVEAAYRRGDALEKRRELMAAWASFLTPKGAKKNPGKADRMRPTKGNNSTAAEPRP
jgi:integrase